LEHMRRSRPGPGFTVDLWDKFLVHAMIVPLIYEGRKRGLEALRKADPPAGYANWEWAALYFYIGGKVWKWQKMPPEMRTVPSTEGPGRGGGSPPHDGEAKAHRWKPIDTPYVTATYIEWWDSNVGAWVTIRNDVGHHYKEMAGGTEMCHVRFLCQEHEVVVTSLER